MYKQYQKTLTTPDLYERLVSTNATWGSPFVLEFSQEAGSSLQMRINKSVSADEQWVSEKGIPKTKLQFSSISDAWRVVQALELMAMGLPDFYRLPMHMMSVLDYILYENYMGKASDKDNQEGEEVGEIALQQPSFSSPLLTLLKKPDKSFHAEINEQMVERVMLFLSPRRDETIHLTEQWWQFLLLLEAIREGLLTGKPIYCPLKGYDVKCSAVCPIKINLSFLAKQSQLVAEQFCDK